MFCRVIIWWYHTHLLYNWRISMWVLGLWKAWLSSELINIHPVILGIIRQELMICVHIWLTLSSSWMMKMLFSCMQIWWGHSSISEPTSPSPRIVHDSSSAPRSVMNLMTLMLLSLICWLHPSDLLWMIKLICIFVWIRWIIPLHIVIWIVSLVKSNIIGRNLHVLMHMIHILMEELLMRYSSDIFILLNLLILLC